MKAMIFAAGLGTRLKPLTDDRPKALIEIAGKPLLEYVISRLISFGFREITINVHHFADQILDFLKKRQFKEVRFYISDEHDQLRDTGGGLKRAAKFLSGEEPVLLHNVDVLSKINIRSMLIEHATAGILATLAVSRRDSNRKLLFNSENQLVGWRNEVTGEVRGKLKKGQSYRDFAFSGVHIIDPIIYKMMPAKDVFSIIDLYLDLCKKYPIKAFEHDPQKFLDIGKPEQLAKAENFLR